jgi:SAM-dependent methyltransferase
MSTHAHGGPGGIHSALLSYLQSEQAIRPPAAILELGCGDGRNAYALAERGYQVTAIDMSEVQYGQARSWARERRLPVEFREMNALDVAARFPPASFNLVLVVDFLHTIPSERVPHLFVGVQRVLASDGVFLVIDSVPIARLIPDVQGFVYSIGEGYAILRPTRDK